MYNFRKNKIENRFGDTHVVYYFSQMDDLLNVTDAAKFIRVTRKTIYVWEKKGKLNRVMIGRMRTFKKAELLEAKSASAKIK